ncbi:MAG: sodium-translocating pyrophosphatase [Candidatus Parvarchaeota archaeon]|nr:sodium-translocating pyrophosphatase [Candidatus Jingweiarchaeum tengchongense]MCW1297669.1 sodium-translocating pyrophosphatase [Candidatus Jingweiarchaeum tengchongense]MCW1299680.1 sodium-translocating pyrophosphatase [Candidatus Jingweiarchaeum tengchongense]MCW1304352.1 sodium-translocating pyrophosphatase [Candidatus Jingweiarchaeum tengchongense]MCW1305665.1 sodium-translocating pyrophosphatase [Candidatus Jingweiarchaeum tengchongense]
MDPLLLSLLAALVSIFVGLYFYKRVNDHDPGTPRMVEIAGAISEGARAFLKRQYMTLAIFVVVVGIILTFFIDVNMAIAYVIGAVCSGLAGLLGMDVAIKANVRTANASRKGINQAFKVAFYGGAVMGLAVVGLALLGITVLYWIYKDVNIVLGFSFGASSIALFAKAGGGIYTKTADIGADLVGKVEMNIPEDDPRNPAVIADNVGDNVGDVAGMGADIFDSYVASIIAAMILGVEIMEIKGALFPLLLAAAGILASVIGMYFVKIRKKEHPGAALNRGTFSTCIVFAILAYLVSIFLGVDINIYLATIAGLVAGVVIGITTDYFTSIDRPLVKNIAESAKTGAAINILSGFSFGLISVAPPVIGICIAMVIAWNLAGIYGISIAAIGMLSITGMIVSSDAYGPIVDNAKGIAEQSHLGEKIIAIADQLDAAGNTAKAVTKGFAIGAAALTVLALFAAYAEITEISSIDLMNPYVITGAFIGAMMPPLLCALLILGVGKNAFKMVEEIRRQFKEIPGLMKGKAKPDYARCVDIATKGALKELILPSILSLVVPVATGFLLGKYALGGFLAGSILTGIIFALLMANAGGAWDNAKKYIEEGNFGGKGSEAHKAAVVGDTVGDPFKDTAGPSINTLITVMSLSASVFAPLILKYMLIR